MRRPSLTPPPRRLRAAAVGAAALVLSGGLAGCGSGQLAQTRLENPVIDGSNAAVGPVLVRYAYIPTPEERTYPVGGTASIMVTFVNTTDQPVTLVGLESPAAQRVQLVRGTAPAAQPEPAVAPEPPGAAPAAAEPPAEVLPTLVVPPRQQTQLVGGVDYSIQLTGLTEELRAGSLVSLTLRFDQATGEVQVPVQLPLEKPPGTAPHEEG